MSKDLEKEITAYVEEIKPDLWNRIEEQLPAKNISRNDTQVLSNLKPLGMSQEQKTGEIKEFRQKRLHRYAGVIAAAIALALIIPALVMNREELKNGNEASIHKTTKQEVLADNVEATIVIKDYYGDGVVIKVLESSSEYLSTEGLKDCDVAEGIELLIGKQYECQMQVNADGTGYIKTARELE